MGSGGAELTTNLSQFLPSMIGANLFCYLFTRYFGKGRSFLEKFVLFYLILSAIIHTFLEAYWAVGNGRLDIPDNFMWDTQRRVWIEFGKCDSRWLESDDCIYGLEVLAGFFCGPMAWITIYAYIKNKPWRHVVQPVCVVAQAYGLYVTWIPEVFEGMIHVPTDNFVLHYGYFWAMQAPWMIIPIIMVFQSCYELSKMKKPKKE